MIVALRTDQPEACVAIYTPHGVLQSSYARQAHRQLAHTLLGVIRDQLAQQHKTFQDISGVVVFQGPGSFTGLRIGISVANALAYGQGVPVVGSGGEDWDSQGVIRLLEGANDKIILPEYGAEARITLPKK